MKIVIRTEPQLTFNGEKIRYTVKENIITIRQSVGGKDSSVDIDIQDFYKGYSQDKMPPLKVGLTYLKNTNAIFDREVLTIVVPNRYNIDEQEPLTTSESIDIK